MSFELLQLPHALRRLRQLRKAHSPRYNEIMKAILALAENPRSAASEKLVGRPERRIRIGDYRVIYRIDNGENTITVIAVAHRREVLPALRAQRWKSRMSLKGVLVSVKSGR